MYERAFASGECRKCHAGVLNGATDGLDYAVDPRAITARGELAALLQGRITFAVHDGVNLRTRAAWDMATRARPVVAEHRCHLPPLDNDPTATDALGRALHPIRQEQTGCPF